MSARVAGRAAVLALGAVSLVASVTPAPASANAAVPTLAAVPASRIMTTTGRESFRAAPALVVEPETTAPPVARVAVPSLAVTASSDAPVSGYTVTLVREAPVPSTAQAATVPCERTSRGSSRSSHTHSSSTDDGGKRWRVSWSSGDCSYEIESRGEVRFNRDVSDVESISSGGSFVLEQHLGDDTRRLVVRPRSDGTLDRSYSLNGARREFDADARAWLAEALVALDRQTAFAVDQRVPAILERSGVNGVLQEIALLGGDYARRRYYTTLLSLKQLDRAQIRRVVEQAGSEMSSSYELAELLVALAKLDAFSDDSHTAFVSAAKRIDSDYERRRALNALLNRDQLAPGTVQSLLDAASTIDSDYELAELLIDVSKRYAINAETRPVYIKAVGSIGSDYEHRRVLGAIVSGGGLTPAVSRALLEDARRINSDYELAEFLIAIAKRGALDASTADAYFAAADKIKSDYEHRRALMPLLSRDILKSTSLAKALLASAAKIDSDYECATFLIAFANAIVVDDELRPAYDRAADSIQTEYEYGRAMSAVRRRVTR